MMPLVRRGGRVSQVTAAGETPALRVEGMVGDDGRAGCTVRLCKP
ncbi:MAG: hypothetical protein ABFD96_16765 [Armatimonadia bacterium]